MSSKDARQCQGIMIRAIDEYTDRHHFNFSEDGAKDLKTLSACNPPNVYKLFGSSVENGLPSSQVQTNGQNFGINEYKKRQRKSLFHIFKDAICDEMLIILMFAAVISVIVEYFAGEQKDMFWVDGVSILIAVIVCTLVATVSNYQKERQFDQLDKMTENTYNYEVVRDGKRTEVHRSKIVPGDMILITNGMEIPADCLLLKAVNVLVNESAITGQSHQLDKNIFQRCWQQRMDAKGPTPFMVSGSNVVSGEGIMMALVVGKDSRAGKNFELIFSKQEEDDEQQTPLQKQLQRLSHQIGRFGILSAITIFIILFVRLLVEQLQKGGFDFKHNIGKIVQYLIIAVTVVVVAIPEGLPLAVTLTLAYSMRAMYEDKILVRKLASCETMGAAKFICSDKTGTITQNKMNAMHFVNTDSIPIDKFYSSKINGEYLKRLEAAVFHNSTGVADTQKGPQTQIALIKMVRKLTGRNQLDLRKQIGIDGYFKRLPFDSNRKRMTTGLTLDNRDYLFMGGASQQILEACSQLQNYQTGQVTPLTPQIKAQIIRQLQTMAGRGLRTVSVAYKQVNKRELQSSTMLKSRDVIQDIQKSGFTLLGVFGIQDPPRPQSKGAIEDCKRAGIHLIMVTGDNKITASNIAKQVGIISQTGQGGKIMEASQFIKALQNKGLLKQQVKKAPKKGHFFNKKEDKQQQQQKQATGGAFTKMKKVILQNERDQQTFKQILDDLVVMARSKPEHKYILVDGINKLGHIVGVTGDGANDAPALMRADIGLAMGVTGTQVSKNASDIILLDDNFQSIVRAIVWGRNVYTSIRKFLQFQLTVNMIAVCMILISAAIIRQSIFASVQMLWVNLIMDSLAALALATQPPNHEELLNQKPNSPDQRLLTGTMIKHIIGQALFQLAVLLTLLFLGPLFIPQFKDGYDQVIGSDLSAKYYNGIPESTVTDGKFYQISGHEGYKVWFDKYHNHSRHFTFIFNTFVFLQVFNFICCRRIKDQLNFFNKICASKLFWIIVFLIVFLQALVITFGGRFFQVYKYHGLTIVQWLLSVGIGSLTMPVSIFLRLLPFAKPKDKVQKPKVGLKFNEKTGFYENYA